MNQRSTALITYAFCLGRLVVNVVDLAAVRTQSSTCDPLDQILIINIQIDEPQKNISLEDKIENAVAALASAAGVDKITAEVLVSNGYLSVDDLLDADSDELMNLPGVDADELQTALDKLNAR